MILFSQIVVIVIAMIGPLSSSTNIVANLDSENLIVYPNPNNKIFSIQTRKKIVKIEILIF